MKTLLFLLLFAGNVSANLTVHISAVDSLSLPFTLKTLLLQLEQTLADVDRPEYLRRRWSLTRTYYRFHSAKEELQFQERSLENLQAIHELNHRKHDEADITDPEFLQSGIAVLGKRITLLSATESCRELIISILELANVEIIIPHERTHAQTSQDAHALRD